MEASSWKVIARVFYIVEGGFLSQTCNVILRHYKLLWHRCNNYQESSAACTGLVLGPLPPPPPPVHTTRESCATCFSSLQRQSLSYGTSKCNKGIGDAGSRYENALVCHDLPRSAIVCLGCRWFGCCWLGCCWLGCMMHDAGCQMMQGDARGFRVCIPCIPLHPPASQSWNKQ